MVSFNVTKLNKIFFSPHFCCLTMMIRREEMDVDVDDREKKKENGITVAGETRVACVKFGVESSMLFCL